MSAFAVLAGAAAAAPAADARYRLPYPDGHAYTVTQAPGGWITTHVTRENRHAVDFAMPEGTPVVAARGGRVLAVEWRHGGEDAEIPFSDHGNTVLIEHADGTRGRYSHLRHRGVAVKPGEVVAEGALLGWAGTTGYSSGPHLHFGVVEVNGGVEASVPVRFYVGRPPTPFKARPGLAVLADYSRPAPEPRSVLEQRGIGSPKLPALLPGEEPYAWLRIALWATAALAGLAWFWHFSRH